MKNGRNLENIKDDLTLMPTQQKQNNGKKTTFLVVVYRIACIVLIIASICFIAFNIVFDYNKIEGKSMQPTYNYPNGDGNDMAYYSSFFDYTKGDVIVAKKNGYNVIKRLFAESGDTFALKKHTDGFYHIYVNNIMQDESYLLDLSQNEHLFETIKNNHETDWVKKVDINIETDSLSFVVPQNYCFYLGDNRLESADCSDYGPVPKENITHKVIFVVPENTNFWAYWWKRIFN